MFVVHDDGNLSHATKLNFILGLICLPFGKYTWKFSLWDNIFTNTLLQVYIVVLLLVAYMGGLNCPFLQKKPQN